MTRPSSLSRRPKKNAAEGVLTITVKVIYGNNVINAPRNRRRSLSVIDVFGVSLSVISHKSGAWHIRNYILAARTTH